MYFFKKYIQNIILNTEMELFLNATKFLKTKCRFKKQINKIKLILF